MTVYGPHCSHDECGWTTCDDSGFVEHCCTKPGCPYCGGLRNEPEDWASIPERFAAMSPETQDRVRAYWDRYPRVRRGPDDDASRLDMITEAVEVSEPAPGDIQRPPVPAHPTCGRWWAWMTGLNITTLTFGDQQPQEPPS